MKKDLTEADLLDMLVAELNAKSFCILRNHQVGRALALASDLDPVFAATPFCEGNFYGRRTKRFGSLLKRSRSEEHTSELQSLMRISYAVFCLKKKKKNT